MNDAVQTQDRIYVPDQPFFVANSLTFTKYIVKRYGILNFYFFVGREGIEKAKAIPAGCIDIVFCCEPDQSEAYVCGPIISSREVRSFSFKEGSCYFGVQFMPGWYPAIFPSNRHFSFFVEKEIALSDIIDNVALTQRITSIQSPSAQIEIFLSHYLPAYHRDKTENGGTFGRGNIIAKTMREILLTADSKVQMQALSDRLGKSARYLNQTFSNEFGIPPKLFFSLIRYQQLILKLNKDDPDINIEDLSRACGYYDRSHMSNDFKAFTGMSVREYHKLIRSIDYSHLTVRGIEADSSQLLF